MNNAKVIRFRGVGGVGKTTMCKVLCNEFRGDFEGQVYHLEFKSKMKNLEKILRKALMSLANLSKDDIEGFDEDQGRRGRCLVTWKLALKFYLGSISWIFLREEGSCRI